MSNDSENQSKNARRQFLKLGGLSLIAATFATQFATPESAQAQAGDVKESDQNAKALGYYEDANKVDLKKFPKRATPAGKKQYCYNCMFYAAKGDAKASEKAPCTIFANKNVKGKGWCNTWAQNPKVKD